MNRLTFDGCFCDIAQCMEPNPCKYDGLCSQRQTWERLKAYEDTGLEPEEILAELDRVKAERDATICSLQDEVQYLKMRLEIEKDHSAQMERERDAALEGDR